ncbi:energy transducer TonB [Mucilaginibacter sp.]|uniref:energy transducer TonB n=1 Tax=Mucilaginibacter sp. TaxID=1882438 RepID=UPI002634C85C|nr:energy transducer TonB [Mucilaginibacter sp.]MDB4924375.1 TonB family protein [Mucilaginibacter sp.]
MLVHSLRYPTTARLRGVQGKVVVAITINKDGVVSNYRVKNAVGYGCDEEALRVVKNIGGDWLPGILDGKPVTAEYLVPVSFRLN